MRGGVNTRKWHGDHGSSQDYTTFFFSNFPHGYTETDMLKVFQRWARVKEVFVSRRLNKWGRRFGFVRFFYVRNVRWLESELDQIIVGNRKLYVNIPKYRKTQEENERYGRRVLRNIDVGRQGRSNRRKTGLIGRRMESKHGGRMENKYGWRSKEVGPSLKWLQGQAKQAGKNLRSNVYNSRYHGW